MTFCWQTSSTTDDLAGLTNPNSNLCTRRRLQGKSSCSDVPRRSAKHSVWVLTTLTGFPFLSCYCAAGFTHSVRVTYAFWASSFPQAGAVNASQPKGIWHLDRSETVRERKLNTCGPEALFYPARWQSVSATGHLITAQQEWLVRQNPSCCMQNRCVWAVGGGRNKIAVFHNLFSIWRVIYQ